MRNFFFLFLVCSLLFSCTFKNQLTYLNDIKAGDLSKVNLYAKNYIEIGDVLKIDVKTVMEEVATPFNNLDKLNNSFDSNKLVLEGYKVAGDSAINFPLLGKIAVVGLTINDLEIKLRKMLINEGQLTNPYIKISKVNSKFTVLGEVGSPGTYFNYDDKLNIFQAIGIAGDLLITAKRKNVKLIRHENNLRKTYEFSLNKGDILQKPYFYIKSNDIIIIEPNYNKIKSAGFIGSPTSIASISSLVLSITLLIINNN